jgi:TonB-dependent SusC/RagA subfamily outer membrane receptor
MKIVRLFAALSLLAVATACAADRALAPQPAARSIASTVATYQVAPMFVVDGVRLPRNHVPTLTADKISSIEVLKGHLALEQYGSDASYGVVVITTKQGSAPRS